MLIQWVGMTNNYAFILIKVIWVNLLRIVVNLSSSQPSHEIVAQEILFIYLMKN